MQDLNAHPLMNALVFSRSMSPVTSATTVLLVHACGWLSLDRMPIPHCPTAMFSLRSTPPGTFSLPTLSQLDATLRLHLTRMSRGSHLVPPIEHY